MPLNFDKSFRYSGQSAPLFRLAFVTGLLTLVSFGVYRFWAKTRLRKYIWSSVSIDGDAFEYTGTGLEKLLGFLVALVFLALYLGTIQLILAFVGLGMVGQTPAVPAVFASLSLSFMAVLPFVPFAMYRARRYRMVRTRLRGIRFGMDGAAWGYALRALGHYVLTAISLGLLLPRQSFYLEKYMTDRSCYGDARFEQGGRWQGLYVAMKHVLFGLGVMVAGGIWAETSAPILGGFVVMVGFIWFFLGFIYYRVHAYTYLTNHKTLAGQVTFVAAPSTGVILKKFILGGIVVALVSSIAFGVLAGIVATAYSGDMGMEPGPLALLPIFVGYVMIFVGLGAFSVVMITQPVIAHLISTLQIQNSHALDAILQRAADDGADADGFADALDLGGGV
jgi:uncharacterized membrane protein YjgN (DUF898 family)